MSNPIKKAGEIESFDPKMAKELIRCQRDPVYFIDNYCRVVHPVKGEVPFKLYDYQKDMIRMYEQKDMRKTLNNEPNPGYNKPGNCVSLCGRQLGKCATGDTMITIRNKHTGEIMEISLEAFHELNR